MKKSFVFLSFLLFLADLAVAAPWGANQDDLPQASAFQGWRTERVEAAPVESLSRIELACDKTTLYPTHPQQDLKTYHVVAYGSYDHFRVDAESNVCLTKSLGRNSAGKKTCLRADTVEHAVLSDTYRDACGNLYRGIWKVTFLRQDDNMGTLFSKGRVMYQKTGSEFLDMYVAGTYAVSAKDFLFLSPLFPGDEARILDSRTRVEKTHRFNSASGLFELKD